MKLKNIGINSKKYPNFDIDDSDFIALTKHIKGFLWTGDKILYNGLKKVHFKQVYNTSDLVIIRKEKGG